MQLIANSCIIFCLIPSPKVQKMLNFKKIQINKYRRLLFLNFRGYRLKHGHACSENSVSVKFKNIFKPN